MKSTMTMESEKSVTNVEKDPNNIDVNLKCFKKVDKTPFTIYGDEEEGYILLMGKYRLTDKMSLRDIKEESTRVTWDRITQVIMAITETMKQEEKQQINN